MASFQACFAFYDVGMVGARLTKNKLMQTNFCAQKKKGWQSGKSVGRENVDVKEIFSERNQMHRTKQS